MPDKGNTKMSGEKVIKMTYRIDSFIVFSSIRVRQRFQR
jgi:hypothetical protein